MGVTVLAWGNSAGDFFADVAISRHGAPSMAVSAVFAGPLFNSLIGTGASMVIATGTYVRGWSRWHTHSVRVLICALIEARPGRE